MEQEPRVSNAPFSLKKFRRADHAFRWEDVEVKEYREGGDFFRSISKQVFFDSRHGLSCELRYFEAEPGGYSAFERHEHVHGVMVLRGRGRVLMASDEQSCVQEVGEHDLIHVPPGTWHQFQADDDEYLGFLCLVNNDRDRPRRPDDEEKRRLRADPTIGPYVRL
ncbi:MAG: cupin domain-containing protein [Spirochaetaceae bacterium]